MALVVPLAQLTTAFPPITQVHPAFCPGLSRLRLLCSPSAYQALFRSSASQQRCCYLNFLASMDGQQCGFAF
jgi:hypothetical protein